MAKYSVWTGLFWFDFDFIFDAANCWADEDNAVVYDNNSGLEIDEETLWSILG